MSIKQTKHITLAHNLPGEMPFPPPPLFSFGHEEISAEEGKKKNGENSKSSTLY